MPGCYFTVSGPKFDVDTFLSESRLQPSAVFYRGQPLKISKGKLRKTSGFSVDLHRPRVFGNLRGQIPKALQFLKKEQPELARLAVFPGAAELWLVFPCVRAAGTYGTENFPPELVTLAGSCRIGIRLSFYPDDDEIPDKT